MNQFLLGALTMACWVAGLFFLRFWRVTGDRIFVAFVVAFWVLAVHWLAIGLVSPGPETRHWAYLARLVAFGIIAAGIVDKNRRQPPS